MTIDPQRRIPATIALCAVVCSSCETTFLDSKVRQGTIEYALSFPDYDPNGLMAGMLPQQTKVTFNEDRQLVELSAGMGVFRTAMISDNSARSMDYHLSVLSKKIVARINTRDLQIFNPTGHAFTILETNVVDTIAGYPCRKSIAVFDRMELPEVALYHTDRIEVKDPNWFGPFKDMPGMLLRYEVQQYGMRMRLEATHVRPGEVGEIRLEKKTGYEEVSPEVLDHELNEVLGTFTL